MDRPTSQKKSLPNIRPQGGVVNSIYFEWCNHIAVEDNNIYDGIHVRVIDNEEDEHSNYKYDSDTNNHTSEEKYDKDDGTEDYADLNEDTDS